MCARITMLRIAWWTCALTTLVSARMYERCELAHDLNQLGIRRDHLATWVCIAYHESRFNTAAYNPASLDHGLLQISELYWCGDGKACGIPCSALRDDEIADDVECALQIHEEHTRLQGDGFTAWVVYPLHCMENTKKYLADCDATLKNHTKQERPKFEKGRFLSSNTNKSNATTRNNLNLKIDELKPPYLAINALVRETYGRTLYGGVGKQNTQRDWINFKINNIDSLSLPVFNKNSYSNEVQTTTLATMTSTPRPVSPTPIPVRRIESNDFRHGTNYNTITMPKAIVGKGYESISKNAPSVASSTESNMKTEFSFTTLRPLLNYSFINLPKPSTTTQKPETRSTKFSNFTTSPLFNYISKNINSESTTKQKPDTRESTSRSPITFTLPTSVRPVLLSVTTTQKPTFSFTTTSLATTSTTEAPKFYLRQSSSSSISPKPASSLLATITTTEASKFYRLQESARSINFDLKPTSLSLATTTTTEAPKFRLDLGRSISYAPKPAPSSAYAVTVRPTNATAAPYPNTSRTTESIFDLYLNPMRRKSLPAYKFSPLDSRYKLKIFSEGTTTPLPVKATSRDPKSPVGGATRNHFRRQILAT